MDQIPLPSPIHYELLLQLLEKQTLQAANNNPELRQQINQLIITLRKAASQQRYLEEVCQYSAVSVDHRWSLNHTTGKVVSPD
jgi:Family of unknown function (DUF5340)